MKNQILIITLLSLLSCQSQERDVELYHFDKSLSLVSVNEELAFRSKSMTDCGYTYWYSSNARYVGEKFSYAPPEYPVKSVLDIKSLRLEKRQHNVYYLRDKRHTYVVVLTICDNTVSYEGI